MLRLGATLPAGAVRVVGLDWLTRDTLKALPESKVLSGSDVFSCKEILLLIKAMGMSGPFDQVGAGADDSRVPAVLSFFVSHSLDPIMTKTGAKEQAWPSVSPGRLGAAIKAFNETGTVAPPSHALAAAFSALAHDRAAWVAFLPTSLNMTAGHTTYTEANSTHAVQMALLDQHLKKCGATEDAIRLRPGQLDADELACALVALGGSKGFPAAERAPPPSGTSLQISMPDLSGTADERRVRLQLRVDASTVESDATLSAELVALTALTGVDKGDELTTRVTTIDGRLARLVTTGADIEKALAGMNPVFVLRVARVRNAIDRHVERSIYKDAPAPLRVQYAMRMVRTGCLSQLRLLHLVDADDDGTDDAPLIGFQTSAKNLTAVHTVVMRVLMITTPDTEVLAKALSFLQSFFSEIEDAVKQGVSWTDASKYYKAIIARVSHPAFQYALGEGGKFGPTFDIKWLENQSEATRGLSDALVRAHAKTFYDKRHATFSDLRDVRTIRGDESDADDTASVGGKRQRRFSSASYEKIEADHPPIDGRKACYFFFAKGNCLKGSECKYHHGS